MSSGLLRFVGIAASDQGKYVCTGQNQFGKAEATAEVIVQGNACSMFILSLQEVVNGFN